MKNIGGLPRDKIFRFVSSRGAIKWNYEAPDSPFLEIGLTDVNDHQRVQIATIALLDALALPIGSVVNSGQITSFPNPVSSTQLSTTVDYDVPSFVNAFSVEGGANSYIIPPFEWRFPRRFGHSKFLDIKDRSGIRLLIPALEIFLQTYGSSAYFKKTFLNFSTHDALRELTYAIDFEKLANQPFPHETPLGLTRNTKDADAPIIHSLNTSGRLRNIHQHLRFLLHKFRQSGCFLPVPFWFCGPIKLNLRGKYVWNASTDKRFLVQEIIGFSYPELPQFFIDRTNTNLVLSKSTLTPPGKQGWARSIPNPSSQEIEREPSLDSSSPVSSDAGSISEAAASVGIIGPQPYYRKSVRKEKQTSDHSLRPPKDHDSYSSSETIRQDGVGAASVSIEQIDDSTFDTRKIKLREIWAGLESLASCDGVHSIEALSNVSDELTFKPEFGVVELESTNSWTAAKADSRQRRLLLVAKITLSERIEHLFEIGEKFSKSGNPYPRHSGAIVAGDLSNQELADIISQLIERRGNWKAMPSDVQSKLKIFRHMKLDTLSMQEVIINVLSEHLGLTLPDDSS